MSLTKEWRSRVESWITELKNHFYIELGTVDFKGFITKEQLTLNEAQKKNFSDMQTGTKWGAKWEYGWFRGSVELPEEAINKRICLRPEVGGEGAVYINGINAGSKDKKHFEITLTRDGAPGSRYDIVIESYAGHGPRIENVLPTPPGRLTVPEPGPTQTVVGRSTYGIWDEDAYQLWIDVDTLYQVRNNINENSLRTSEIDKALRDFTLIVDFELPYEERVETFKRGRERLKPLLECKNGSTAPLMYIVGQSHLDLAWLWPKAETERKIARTMSTQLALLDEYKDYKFFFCEPPLHEMLKELYPDLFERVKQKAREGQIIAEGGIWVESDTNLPSGESLIRQLMYGKMYFEKEYGVDSKLLWLPDVFGFSAVLPQLMKGCNIKYFCTKKIIDNYNGGDPFPYNIFMWEGIDGTRVLSHIIRKSNSPIDPQTLIKRWEFDRRQKDDISTFLFPFGFGDGGGGPIRDHLEYIERMEDLEGVPRTKMCDPDEFFEDLEKQGVPENRYVGELYFQAHRGTYTSQAKTKKGNRKSEFALREAEMWGSIAKSLYKFEYPYEKMDSAWKKVLFNQFHDVLTGASIKRVHDEAEADYSEVLKATEDIINTAAFSMTGDSNGITVFNSLSWERKELVCLPEDVLGICDSEGKLIPVQELDGKVYAEATLPSCGWAGFTPVSGSAEVENTLGASDTMLENELIRITLNSTGEITSIFDKEANQEFAAGICNSFRMYKDVTTNYDAWDIDSMYSKAPVELGSEASTEVLYKGPLICGVRIKRKINNSELTQDITLRRGSRKVEFKTRIDWKETHKLLKVAFPVDIYTNEVLNEIQFGYVKRPNHKSRQYDSDRYEVCNHKWSALTEENRGFAILNDCKYGISAEDGCLSLTLLKSALAPDMYADKGVHEFTYGIYLWNGPFVESNVTREGYELNCPALTLRGNADNKSLFSVNSNSIVIDTVKPAEDGSEDIILRLYESVKSRASCRLSTTLPVKHAEEVNMLEKEGSEINLDNCGMVLNFRPFEIKTIRLKL